MVACDGFSTSGVLIRGAAPARTSRGWLSAPPEVISVTGQINGPVRAIQNVLLSVALAPGKDSMKPSSGQLKVQTPVEEAPPKSPEPHWRVYPGVPQHPVARAGR